MSQSILQGAKDVKIYGGFQIAAAPGGSVTINQAAQARALDTLSAAAAHAALHDSAARFPAPRCHRNTRTTYLDGLERWMRGLASEYDYKHLIWLNGGAGAGKSAIMQSIVERCAQHAVILGAFFFSHADPSRNYAEVLIPTLAYQLACHYPAAMAVLEPIIQQNPLIFKATLRTQAEKLLVRPLLHLVDTGVIDTSSPLRRMFVIDGLDECDNREKQAHIIQVVAAILCDYDVPVSFLIASRPETAIGRAFNTEKRVHSVFASITLNDDADARADIRQFIEDSFLDIRESHPQRKHIPLNWPRYESIDILVWKSSGHFIYAATVMKFISSSDELPERALQVMEGLAHSRTGNPFSELDALYLHIITSAKHKSEVLEILRHCTFTRLGKTVRALCFMYPHFSPEDVELFLSDVQALVSLSPDEEAELCISLKHASLSDFLKDKDRSDGFYMSAGSYRTSLLPRYFMLLDDSSPLSFPYGRFSSGHIDELKEAIEHSQDIESLQSLICTYPPQRVWNFFQAGENDPMSAYHLHNPYHLRNPRNIAISAVSSYLQSISKSAANHDNALLVHHLKTFIPILMEDLNKLIEMSPQYRIIRALIFSSRRCCLITVAPHLIDCFPQLIQVEYGSFLKNMHYLWDGEHPMTSRQAAKQAYKATRTSPYAQMSWGSNLASVLKLVLQRLFEYRWTPEYLVPNRHQQWLSKAKPSKHVSQGSPKLASAVHSYLFSQGNPRGRYHDRSLRGSDWVRGLYKGGANEILDRRWECIVFLEAIIHYLHKCDCTSSLAKLARRLLPKAALWSPRLMKKARRKMDAYVRRWDESLGGVLEKTQFLAINDMD